METNRQTNSLGTGMRPSRSMDGMVAARPQRPKSRAIERPRMRLAPEVAVPKNQFLLPKYHAPMRPARIVKKRVMNKRLALRTVSSLIALLLLGSGFFAWKGYSQFHKVFHGSGTVAALAGNKVAPQLLKGEGSGRVNILLMGIGGPGHDGPDLTDTLVVLSVDPVNNTATMLSVPRDLWVKMPVNYFGSQQKINAAYESGKYHYLGKMDPSSANAGAVEAGFASVDQVMKSVFDLRIDYHVLVNFQAFRQAIDTVGGITVNVPTPLVDPTMAWENHWNPVLAKAGVQQMNGVQALLYARSRETTSDFARGQRQRQILVALKDKVLTVNTLSNPAKIDSLMNAFGDNVYSDMSTRGATRLYSIMKHVSDNKIDSIGLTDEGHVLITTDRVGNASVDRPIAGFNNYSAIQSYVRSQMPDGYLVKEHAGVVVLGGNQVAAENTASLLKSYGYNVLATSVTANHVSTPEVVDLSNGKDPYTLHYLETRYPSLVLHSLPPGITVSDGNAKFVILEP